MQILLSSEYGLLTFDVVLRTMMRILLQRGSKGNAGFVAGSNLSTDTAGEAETLFLFP